MISFASIDRIVEDEVVLEILMHTTTESVLLSVFELTTCMSNVNREMFPEEYEPYNEGDILVVNHENGDVLEIYGKDDEEKERRINARKERKIIILES